MKKIKSLEVDFISKETPVMFITFNRVLESEISLRDQVENILGCTDIKEWCLKLKEDNRNE